MSPHRPAARSVVAIPYHSDPNAKYLPSIAQAPAPGIAIGDTLPEYPCGRQARPNCNGRRRLHDAAGVPGHAGDADAAQLAAGRAARHARVSSTRPATPTSPFNGLSVCELRSIDSNTGLTGHTAQVAAANGRPAYTVQMDPNTARRSRSAVRTQRGACPTSSRSLPPRGTTNDITNYQFTGGFRGDLGFSDWTWDTFISHGESRTSTAVCRLHLGAELLQHHHRAELRQGLQRARARVSRTRRSPARAVSIRSRRRRGTLQISQDCLNAIVANQSDRETMRADRYPAEPAGRALQPAGGRSPLRHRRELAQEHAMRSRRIRCGRATSSATPRRASSASASSTARSR